MRLGRLRAHGIQPGLSVDATAMASGDMFSPMRAAFAAARSEELPADATAAYDPHTVVRDILELATIRGAEAIGLGDVCGTLTPGKAADVVIIRGDALNTAPVVDPVATVVLSADTSNVDTVIVGGTIVKRNGHLADVDIATVVRDAAAARDRVLRSAGWGIIEGA